MRASSVDVRTVGAGGGSIAHVPAADQGAAGRPAVGRRRPRPGRLRQGRHRADRHRRQRGARLPAARRWPAARSPSTSDAARAAVQTIADAMGLESPEAAAAGIVDIVNENMLGGAAAGQSVQQGFDPRDFALVAFGGAGPLHANALGRLTGAWPVIVPPSPGVLCALGDATTSLRDESARTVLRRFADLSGGELRADPARARRRRPRQRLADQGVPRDQQTVALPGRRPLPRPGLRDPGRRRRDAGSTTWTARSAGWGRRSTPSTTGCSPSCSTSTTSWSTPAPRSPARARTSPRSHLEQGDGDPPAAQVAEHHGSTSDGASVDGRRLRPAAAAGRRRRSPARRSSPRWTPPPSSCPGTPPPCTRPAAC